MIYAIGGSKGGVGKTTMCLNISAVLAGMGRRVVVLDTDVQNAITKLVAYRSGQDIPQYNCSVLLADKQNHRYMYETIQRYADSHDDVLVDCPPGTDQQALRSALVVADILVTPVCPGITDSNSMEQMDALVSEVRAVNPDLKALLLVNNTEFGPRESYTAEFRDVLNESVQYSVMQSQIGARRSFKYASIMGRSVLEYEDRAERVAKAREELNEFIKELLSHDPAKS
jgi:chromosome partitioning protein